MISIQVSVKQSQATAPPPLISACIELSGQRATGPRTASPSQPNILIDQGSNGLLMGKLPLPVDSSKQSDLWSSTVGELQADFLGKLFQEHDLKRSLSSFKADECSSSSSRPLKKQRTSTQSTKKTVRFEERTQPEVIPIPEGQEYECHQRWYNRRDYNEFRQDMKMNFFLHSLWMQNAPQQPSPPKDLCIRGLEKFCFYSNQAAVKDMRRLRLNAVLDQQRIQKALGAEDPMTLRLVAEVLSQRVSEQALERGADDYVSACLV